jgi:hypothetical protein
LGWGQITQELKLGVVVIIELRVREHNSGLIFKYLNVYGILLFMLRKTIWAGKVGEIHPVIAT